MKVLGLDEITPHKGHGRYHLIITAPELGIVLDVLNDRKKGTLEVGQLRLNLSTLNDLWAAYPQ